MKKRKLGLILMLVLVISLLSVQPIFASNASDDYFYFGKSDSKYQPFIDQDGSFWFRYSWAMNSDYFNVTSSSITLKITATSDPSNANYKVALVNATDDKNIKTVTFTANGTEQSYTFTNLDTSKLYNLYFSQPLFGGGTIEGTGHISNIKR